MLRHRPISNGSPGPAWPSKKVSRCSLSTFAWLEERGKCFARGLLRFPWVQLGFGFDDDVVGAFQCLGFGRGAHGNVVAANRDEERIAVAIEDDAAIADREERHLDFLAVERHVDLVALLKGTLVDRREGRLP